MALPGARPVALGLTPEQPAHCLRGFPECPRAAPSRVGDPSGLGRRGGVQGAARGVIREKRHNLPDPGVHHSTPLPQDWTWALGAASWGLSRPRGPPRPRDPVQTPKNNYMSHARCFSLCVACHSRTLSSFSLPLSLSLSFSLTSPGQEKRYTGHPRLDATPSAPPPPLHGHH